MGVARGRLIKGRGPYEGMFKWKEGGNCIIIVVTCSVVQFLKNSLKRGERGVRYLSG